MFHGSYLPYQVQFLLKPISIKPIANTLEKERFIQSGEKHYSEMLSPESPPSPEYLALFQAACEQNLLQMAQDCVRLAALIAARDEPSLPVLVSLARAGTPVGVVLQHILSRHYQQPIAHFSISIIRDRGIDTNALEYILQQGFAPEQIVFVDGWTGKGVIKRELDRFIAQFNQQHHTHIRSDLYVLSDLAGVSGYAASCEDYLIPSAILNACISGLVSRSILNEQIASHDFHGCVYFAEFAPYDLSQTFIQQLTALTDVLQQHGLPAAQAIDTAAAAHTSQTFLAHIMQKYAIHQVNFVKPGIGEATRVMLRRVPQLLLLRNPHAAAVQHLCRLATEKNVPIATDAHLPYQAVALIKDIRHA